MTVLDIVARYNRSGIALVFKKFGAVHKRSFVTLTRILPTRPELTG
jgi:hypothetical protein